MSALDQVLGHSPAIRTLRARAERVLARTGRGRLPPVLILGETGTGKGLLARQLHRASPRRDEPFVDVNCAAIPEALFEAELFGFERGAFTDARQAKAGLFQAAGGGTLFLDEVGSLPAALQAKLLHAIEDGAVRRLGSTRAEPVDAWIMAATNQDLQAATRTGRFREDLYHRLAVLVLSLPALRERGADIVLLAEHFLARACADHGLPPKTLAADARAALVQHRWPGNVRELANVLERTALLAETHEVTAGRLELPEWRPPEPGASATAAGGPGLDEALAQIERARLAEALAQAGGNVLRAARALGLSRGKLRYRMDRHGLRPGASARTERRRRRGSPPFPSGLAGPAEIAWQLRPVAFLQAAVPAPLVAPASGETSRLWADLIDKAHAFGGSIEELRPGRLVAAFGLEPAEDAPRRAALAALAMQMAVARGAAGSAAPAVALAVHAASARVARLGDRALLDPDGRATIGRALDGLIGAAGPGLVAVGEAAARLLERRFELEIHGAPQPGLARVYRLVGRERPGFGLGGRMTQFEGREDALALLQARLAQARAGRGAAVAVTGEPGIGKSRLLFEFRRLAGEPAAWLEGRCLSYATTTPYLPLLDVLRTQCGIADGDSPAAIAAKVRGVRQAAGLGEERPVALLLHLLGVREGTDAVAGLGPEAIRAGTTDALRETLVRAGHARPIVLVVEDLHWIDASSEEFLARMVDGVVAAPLLLLVTFRPEYRAPWLERSSVSRIGLAPLSPEASAAVMRSALQQEDVPAPLARRILDRAEGNPFFIEEVARALLEGGADEARANVPETIQGVLSARMDRLPEAARSLLQAAAAIGRDVPLALLAPLVDRPDDELRGELSRLTAAEFLHESADSPEPAYTFRHALTHETAYASMAPERREALHARLVATLERRRRALASEPVEPLADHAFRGALWEKAATYCREAGTRAAVRSSNREAVARFEEARVALQHLPERRATLEAAIDVRIDLRNALISLGDTGLAFRHLTEAATLAETAGDPRREGRIAAYLTSSFGSMGDPDRGIASGRRALAIASDLGDLPTRLLATHFLSLCHIMVGEFGQAGDLLRQNVTLLRGERSDEPFGRSAVSAVVSRAWLAFALAQRGEFTEGLRHGREGVEIAEAVGHPFSRVVAYFGLGTLQLYQGDLVGAVSTLERGLTLARKFDVGMYAPSLAASVGWAHCLAGRAEAALPLLEPVLEQRDPMGLMHYHALRLAYVGEAYLRVGRLDEARDAAERAHRRARDRKERGNEAWALWLLGEIARHGARPDVRRAEGLLREAHARADQLGMRPLVAHCRFDLGQLSDATGDRPTATEHLAAARSLYREMDMRSWQARAEAALGPG